MVLSMVVKLVDCWAGLSAASMVGMTVVKKDSSPAVASVVCLVVWLVAWRVVLRVVQLVNLMVACWAAPTAEPMVETTVAWMESLSAGHLVVRSVDKKVAWMASLSAGHLVVRSVDTRVAWSVVSMVALSAMTMADCWAWPTAALSVVGLVLPWVAS